MTKISIFEAAKQGYASRPTIYRRLENGDLTAEKVKRGKRELTLIEVSELVRVFGEPEKTKQSNKNAPMHPRESGDNAETGNEINALRAELETVKRELAREREERERDHKREADMMDLLKTQQRQLTAEAEAKAAAKRGGLFGIFGGKK